MPVAVLPVASFLLFAAIRHFNSMHAPVLNPAASPPQAADDDGGDGGGDGDEAIAVRLLGVRAGSAIS